MAILTIRLTEEENRLLLQLSRRAGIRKTTIVRQIIGEASFETAADVLADAEKRRGDKRLRIRS